MKKKAAVLLTAAAAAALCAALPGALSRLRQKRGPAPDALRVDIDLPHVPDGTYAGKYAAFLAASEVAVTVQNHKVVDINLLRHKNGRGVAQSGRIILKAVENALQNAASN